MKTIKAFSVISVLAGAVALLSSCDKENPQQYKYEATFYVGGNVAKDAAYMLDVDFGGTTGSIQNMVKSGKDWLC